MKKSLSILFFICIFYFNINAAVVHFYTFTYSNNPAPGFIFITPDLAQRFYLLTNDGDIDYLKKTNDFDDFTNPKVQLNGLITFFSGSKYYVMNSNYDIVDSISCAGNYDVDFHDILLLPNGNTTMMGRDTRIMDLSQTVPGGQKQVLVIGNIIQEFDKDKNLVFQWDSFDHFKITDVTSDVDLTQSAFIACHMNSIFYDTDGNIVASNRELDEITKIDRKTGDIIWRLGGSGCKNNQFRFLNDTIDGFVGFSHQHCVKMLNNGNLLLFDNGDLKPNPYSRAVEYKLDEVNKTIEKVWDYSDSEQVMTYEMGSVQRLPNGNTMIGWGVNSKNLTATEVEPDGKKTLEIAGYQNYAVYKFVYKMHAVTLNADKPGIYDFSSDTNITSVKLEIDSIRGSGLMSLEQYLRLPCNTVFSVMKPADIYKNRWVLSFDSSNILINATFKFFIQDDSVNESPNYTVFYKPNGLSGSFTPLGTTYNNNEKCFEANITGPGEFILGKNLSVVAPTLISPADSATNVGISTQMIWKHMAENVDYRLQLAYNPDFSSLVADTSNIADTSIVVNLNYNTTYYWRLKTDYDNEESPWSDVRVFSTLPVSLVDYQQENQYLHSGKESFLLIKYNDKISGSYLFSIYDILGNLVCEKSGSLEGTFQNSIEFDTSHLLSGIYFYRVILKYEIKYGKIIIE